MRKADRDVQKQEPRQTDRTTFKKRREKTHAQR